MLYTGCLFIPNPLCKRPRYYKLGTYKTVRFPRQVAECLTKLPENVSLEHFPFLYRDLSFIAFLVSTDALMVATRLNPCTAYQILDRGGVGFRSKTTALITWKYTIFQLFWSTTNLYLYHGAPAVELLVYSDLHNKKR